MNGAVGQIILQLGALGILGVFGYLYLQHTLKQAERAAELQGKFFNHLSGSFKEIVEEQRKANAGLAKLTEVMMRHAEANAARHEALLEAVREWEQQKSS